MKRVWAVDAEFAGRGFGGGRRGRLGAIVSGLIASAALRLRFGWQSGWVRVADSHVIGCGGNGSGAIQGARIAGAEHIIAVDRVDSKRDKLIELGATHFVTGIDKANALIADLTGGVMADSAILTVGVVTGELIGESIDLIRKGGTVVLTGLAPATETTATLPPTASASPPTASTPWRGCGTSTPANQSASHDHRPQAL